MNLQRYLDQKSQRGDQEPRYRQLCTTCLQPVFSCYCRQIRRFNPKIQFVILIHPIEFRRRIATGRMSHLCLENSRLIMGQDYSENTEVNELIQNPDSHSVMLYPGAQSLNLTPLSEGERAARFPSNKDLVIFVIDGTWATAKKMVYRSRNLAALSRICFSPPGPSNFRVRKQPEKDCYSTIEAIHHTIELVGASRGFATHARDHDKLLSVFDHMVDRQLEWTRLVTERNGGVHYRRVRM